MPKVTHLTDGNGNVVATREYDAFGNILSETGDWSLARHGFHPNWIELKDSDGMLYLSPSRLYDARTGSFLQREPSNGLAGSYKFARQNPNLFVDPNGREEVEVTEPPPSPEPGPQPQPTTPMPPRRPIPEELIGTTPRSRRNHTSLP